MAGVIDEHYLGRTDWGMRELIWARKIPVVREGRKIYLDICDLEEYVKNNKNLYNLLFSWPGGGKSVK